MLLELSHMCVGLVITEANAQPSRKERQVTVTTPLLPSGRSSVSEAKAIQVHGTANNA
jgi:hypothetical protein